MFINLILICIVGLIVYTNGDLNDTRCGPRQNFAEDAKAFVSNLCRETKLENDAPKYADFIFTYKDGDGTGFS
jgi:hypothetical protein